MTQPPAPLAQLQTTFAQAIRAPGGPAPAGVDSARLQVYQALVHGANEGLLRNTFPILTGSLKEPQWEALVAEFIHHHAAKTPLFPHVAKEFVEFLDHSPPPHLPAWSADLAHWEWLELDAQLTQSPTPHDLLRPAETHGPARVKLHPRVRIAAYDWPVHRISSETRELEPAPTFLMVECDAQDQCKFTELSALIFALLSEIEHAGSCEPLAAVTHIAQQAGRVGDAAFHSDALATVTLLTGQGVLLQV